MQGLIPEPYVAYAQTIFASFGAAAAVTTEAAVAEAIWYAANDPAETLRYPAGDDAMALAQARSDRFAHTFLKGEHSLDNSLSLGEQER